MGKKAIKMKKRVLFVEDDETLIKIGALILTTHGFEVISAPAGKIALEKIAVEKFDIILLDVMLPDVDGFYVCQQIRKNPQTANIPIVMLTGKNTQEDRDRGTLCGANSYLVKPFKTAVIINEINKQLAIFEAISLSGLNGHNVTPSN